MLVTINTDASFHSKLKYGGYAFWAVSDRFKITKSGVFKNKCVSTDDTETKCIINALKMVLMNHSGITKVIVNTDSLNASAILKKDKSHIRRYARLNASQISKLQKVYDNILTNSKNKITVEFRHVRSHTGIDDKRSFVNEWCDTEAKKAMWKEINSLKN